MTAGGEEVAALVHDPALLDEPALVESVRATAGLVLEASRADAAASDVLSRAQDEVEQAIAELRELARGIHPTLLRDEGPKPRLRRWDDERRCR